jgi:AMMECR1 domain-containing protein
MKLEKIKKFLVFLSGLILIFIVYLALLQNLPISQRDGGVLIEIAGAVIEGKSYTGDPPQSLSIRKPVFVSIYKDGSRISCLGYTNPFFPLFESVEYLSKGTNIKSEEIDEIVITVFGSYKELGEGEEIPGTSGILVRKDGFEGVVLPSTFKEERLSDEEAFELAALKAGFSSFSRDDFEVYTYDAEIFRSSDY